MRAKRYDFSVMQALAQTLADMSANPSLERTVFGMISNGEDYVFLKLLQPSHQYGLSKKVALANPQKNELFEVT